MLCAPRGGGRRASAAAAAAAAAAASQGGGGEEDERVRGGGVRGGRVQHERLAPQHGPRAVVAGPGALRLPRQDLARRGRGAAGHAQRQLPPAAPHRRPRRLEEAAARLPVSRW